MGRIRDSNIPVQVSGLTGMVAIAGGNGISLALKGDDGTVWAWGSNGVGELGNLTLTILGSNTPVAVSGLTGVMAIGAGSGLSVALTSDGTVWDWGYYGSGGGNGTNTNGSKIPVAVPGLIGVVAIATGSHHALALKGGTVWAWGENVDGELGNGTDGFGRNNTPVPVSNLDSVVAIGGEGNHSLALKSDGTMRAWAGLRSATWSVGSRQKA